MLVQCMFDLLTDDQLEKLGSILATRNYLVDYNNVLQKDQEWRSIQLQIKDWKEMKRDIADLYVLCHRSNDEEDILQRKWERIKSGFIEGGYGYAYYIARRKDRAEFILDLEAE